MYLNTDARLGAVILHRKWYLTLNIRYFQCPKVIQCKCDFQMPFLQSHQCKKINRVLSGFIADMLNSEHIQ